MIRSLMRDYIEPKDTHTNTIDVFVSVLKETTTDEETLKELNRRYENAKWNASVCTKGSIGQMSTLITINDIENVKKEYTEMLEYLKGAKNVEIK